MARQDSLTSTTVTDPGVGETATGWYAAHACGWIETGYASYRGAQRMLERHIAFVCAAPTCHHP